MNGGNLKKNCVLKDDNSLKWLNLPPEIWLVIISKNLNNTFDVIRFRSVCSLWRSLFPPTFLSSSCTCRIPDGKFLLFIQTKIYRLESSCSSNKGWIIKVEESKSGKFHHLDVLTNTHISHKYPFNVLDLTNLRVKELCHAYTINFSKDGGDLIKFKPLNEVFKVVLFSVEGLGQMVFVLYKDRKLRVSNIGYNNLIIVDDGSRVYDDIVFHMGKIYVVDNSGIVFWIDCSSFKLVQCSSSLNCDTLKKKNLISSNGSLFIVELYLKRTTVNTWKLHIDVNVLRVGEKSSEWICVRDLGDALFVLGKDTNFSLLAKDYHGFEGNCIYFMCKGKTSCYNLKTSRLKIVDDIFGPCPTLFKCGNKH
ncbi:F-box protein At2g26160-like [Vicia villosa]|uniref:F-box protein At2g26160-like n=1 Tax=Vicia villosa TaxID=3911 RepID=UPI00273BF1DC|nr:F-box protein At2g26160-like [Vicia villosa]